MTAIKICGITNLADADCAAQAGADLLGFIFYPPSPRYLEPRQAGRIAAALRAGMGDRCPRLVGVFVDTPVSTVCRVVSEAQLDLVQLHGDEPVSVLAALQAVAFKAVRPQSLDEVERMLPAYARIWSMNRDHAREPVPHLLLDAYHPVQKGGTGERADSAIARSLAGRCRLILAGGLNPENVAGALADVHPWGVDVSSGVERAKGIKDHDRLKAFIDTVRATE